ncbi:hypothetical protein IE53DRAFT_385136 [Violaceomyces palustris]|uniref:Uncharacterized protein n=1 Tax=Violaceomyces palustris TaxID=1673888 RepID=A0ACD0P363_9BASI|nr:hypothetical protein IE53DRAFT_385136 [Violaceomyces palustris]
MAMRASPCLLSPAVPNSSRAAALANAAQASNVASKRLSESQQHQPRESYQSINYQSSRSSQQLVYEQSLTSTQSRRSRASLHSSKSYHPCLNDSINLPLYVQRAVNQAISSSDRHLLRQDLIKVSKDENSHLDPHSYLPPNRSSLLHLATISPYRYAVILSVLTQVSKMALDLEAGTSNQDGVAFSSWVPDTVVDYDCSASEGLWAACEVFSSPAEMEGSSSPAGGELSQDWQSGGLRNYHGYDRRTHLLKAGRNLIESALGTSEEILNRTQEAVDEFDPRSDLEGPIQGVQEGLEEGEERLSLGEEVEEEGNVEDEDERQAFPQSLIDETRSKLSRIATKFGYSPPCVEEELSTLESGEKRLALSAFSLSSMTTDDQRREAVQRMWDSGAQVLVLIDQPTPRGFASIASARSQLLELGKHTKLPGVEGESHQVVGSHVVSPCPHDRPCPLLHPFDIPTLPQASSSAVLDQSGKKKKNKDGSSPTGLKRSDMETCNFSQRFNAPSYLRKTKHSKQGEEEVGYSYVIVKRGTRPGLKMEAARISGRATQANPESMAGTHLFQKSELERLFKRAEETKQGILDKIRSTKAALKEKKKLEEVGKVQILGGPNHGQELGAMEPGEDLVGDEEAKAELDRLLPEALRAEMVKGGMDESTIQAVMDQLMRNGSEEIGSEPASDLDGPHLDQDGGLEEGFVQELANEEERGYPESEEEETDPKVWLEQEEAMKLQSYSWPRLLRPPLKKGGHVTMDACCSNGNIERFTMAKSQGRQVYQDARKSQWGDLFPHKPKNGFGQLNGIKVVGPLPFGVGDGFLETEQEGGLVDLDGLELSEKAKKRKSAGLVPQQAVLAAAKIPNKVPKEVSGLEDEGLIMDGEEEGDEIMDGLLESDEQALERLQKFSTEPSAATDPETQGQACQSKIGTPKGTQSRPKLTPSMLIGADKISPKPSALRKSAKLRALKWGDGQGSGVKAIKGVGFSFQLADPVYQVRGGDVGDVDLDSISDSDSDRRGGSKVKAGGDGHFVDPNVFLNQRGSVLQKERKRGRLSRKKSRGDYDNEIFG